MKKAFILIAAGLLALSLAGCSPAEPASEAPSAAPSASMEAAAPEETQPAPITQPSEDSTSTAKEGVWVEADAASPIETDLDEDGELEKITLSFDEDAYRGSITVEDGDSEQTLDIDFALAYISCHIGDALLGDGQRELYIVGDESSCDYVTLVLFLKDGKPELREINGVVELADGSGSLAVETTINVMGTYGATCTYAVEEQFDLVLSSPYTIFHSPEARAERQIVLKKDGFPAKTADGSKAELKSGARLLVTETDCESYALLEGEDGEIYTVDFTIDDSGWPIMIGGEAEEEWFETLRYAG